MDNVIQKTYPELMSGKRLLYVHGFASSGSSGTVTRLRELLPQAEVIAPDLPVHPAEAIELLRRTCDEEKPALVIGTSMGGMYAEMLHGIDRILVNPAFQMGSDILRNNMLGRVTFLNPRADGLREFMMTKQLMEEYRSATEQCFCDVDDGERRRVYGLFGLEDDVVDTYAMFAAHYPNAIHFHGGHRLNDSVLLHTVLPVVRWIDDRQEGRERRIVYIAVEDTLERNGQQLPSALKAYRQLIEAYDVRPVAKVPTNDLAHCVEMAQWVADNIGAPAYDRLVMTNRRDLLYGDYLIDSAPICGSENFTGTRIELGSETFKTWDDIIEYFDKLGGQ